MKIGDRVYVHGYKEDRDANEDICACHLNFLPVTNRVRSKDVNCK